MKRIVVATATVAMDFDELDQLDPVELPDDREFSILIWGATGPLRAWRERRQSLANASRIFQSWFEQAPQALPEASRWSIWTPWQRNAD